MVLGERSLLPSVEARQLCVGKPSVVLGWLTWKWWSEEYLRCLVKAIKMVDQEKQATPKKRANHDISSGILTLMLSCKHWSKDETSQPQQESALDHKWYSFHIGEEWNSKWYLLVFTKLIIGLRIAIGVMNWNLCDYPILQHSKGIIVMCMIISSLTSMRLVHIVYTS